MEGMTDEHQAPDPGGADARTHQGPDPGGADTRTPSNGPGAPADRPAAPAGNTGLPADSTSASDGDSRTLGGDSRTPGRDTGTPGGNTNDLGANAPTPDGNTDAPGGDAPAAGGDASAPCTDGPGAGGRKLLSRSPRLKILGGVCGGLGRYFGIDPVIFRVVLAVLALTGGVGLISYGIGWLLIPVDGDDETELRKLLSGRIDGASMTAVFFALVGSGLFLSTMDNGNAQLSALCLICAVVAAVYWSRRRRAWLAAVADDVARAVADRGRPAAGGTVSEAPPAAQPPPTNAPSWWRTPSTVSFEKGGAGERGRRTGYLWGPESGPGDDGTPGGVPSGAAGGVPGGAPGGAAGGVPGGGAVGGFGAGPGADRAAWIAEDVARRVAVEVRAARREREGAGFGVFVFFLAVLAGSVAVAVRWGGPLGTVLETALTAGLAVLGLGLVVGAFAGRRGHGVLGWAILASFLLAVAATVPKSVGTDWHRATWRPTAVSDVRPLYTLGAGQGILDLTRVPLKGGTVATRVEMGAGQIQVRVADDVTVKVVARVGLGDVRFPQPRRHDVTVSPDNERTGTFPPAAGVKPVGTVTLTLRLGAGQVEVLRGPAS
jgi:phage shock protein PspC (stress-responsive transcriptional regulator)